MSAMLADSGKVQKLAGLDVISIENEFATAKIALFGGQLLSFIPKRDSRDRLWLSEQAILDGSKAIRGGVPLCWPWFSDRHDKAHLTLPNHGYVRSQLWQVVECSDHITGTAISLVPTTTRGTGFDGNAALTLKIWVGEQLELVLVTENLGVTPFSITGALHSYFSVADIETTELKGVVGTYQDKTQNWQSFTTPDPYHFSGETDRIHLCQPAAVSIHSDSQQTKITSAGHDSLVVWNPGQKLSTSMSDMADDGFRTMLCVETALTTPIEILPGNRHTLSQTVG